MVHILSCAFGSAFDGQLACIIVGHASSEGFVNLFSG